MSNESLVLPDKKAANKKGLPDNLAEKDILLSLSKDIASVRDKKDILQLIHPKLKQLFQTDDIFICFLDAANETLDPILRVGGAKRTGHPDYYGTVNSSFPIHDGFIDQILKSTEPLVFDITQFPNPTGYMKLSTSTGIVESLSVALCNGGKVIGILTLWGEERGCFTTHHRQLIAEIANYISIVVVNILAGEALKKKERQNGILLSVSNEIARIHGKEDMLHLIRHTIRQHIYFDDGFILRYNKTTKTCKAYICHVEPGQSEDPAFKDHFDFDYPITDDGIADVPELAVQDVEAFLAQGMKEVAFIGGNGIKEFVSIKLIEGNQLIGFLILLSEKKNAFSRDDLELLKRISYHISIATANIIANEEIASREKEKTILLELSNEIASIRNPRELFTVVDTQVRGLFPIQYFGIAQINQDRTTYSSFITNLPEETKKIPGYDQLVADTHYISDPIFSSIMNTEEPVLFDVEELAQKPVVPAIVKFWKTAGLQWVLGAALKVGGKDVGCAFLHLNSSDTSRIKGTLLKGICAQLAMKTANIIAYENIGKREEEQSILLSLSNEIAGLRNRNDFFDVVITQLKRIFTFDGFAITYIHEDRQTYGVFKVDNKYDILSTPVYRNAMSEKISIDDPVYRMIINAEDAVLFKVKELAREANMFTQSEFWKSKGINQVLSVPLRVGGKAIGTASFHFLEDLKIDAKSTLLKGICAQLAVAISNILAAEEIAKREEEKTILLSLSNDIASLKNRNDLYEVVNNRIKEIFSITQFGIVKINEDGETHSAFMMDLGDEVMSQINFEEVTQLKYSVKDKAFSLVMASDEPIVLDVNELAEEPDPPEYVKFWKYVGFQKLLCVPLRAAGNDIGSVFLNMDEDALKSVKVNLLKGICAQLSVAVSNILATEKALDQLAEINKYKQQLEEEKTYLIEEIEIAHNHAEIIGESTAVKKVFQMVRQVAYSDSTVLLLGETGTGKELVARAIHNASPRKNKLMVKVNCAALPVHLIESELFGHERGSFTGAFERRIGKFELADKGTLFLDEIGEMSLDLQAKLLRALQEKEIERLGGKTPIKTDARIIAATNRDLVKLMAEGKFRADLYYRLNIFPITLPALRDRREDIAALTSFFIARYAKKAGKKINTIGAKALQELVDYEWPGNIRELEHLIERSVLLASGDTIREVHLPNQPKSSVRNLGGEILPVKTIDENEKEYILKILKHVKGRIGGAGGAAELLGVPTSTLNSKMKRLGIRKEHLG